MARCCFSLACKGDTFGSMSSPFVQTSFIPCLISCMPSSASCYCDRAMLRCLPFCSNLFFFSAVCRLSTQAAKPDAVASLTRAFASKLSTRKWEEKELPANVAKTPERDANGANASSPAAQRGHLPCLRCLSQPVAHSNSRSLLRVLDSLFLPPGQRTR